MTTIALIVAAGTGSRSGLDFPKQYLDLDGETVLARSISGFLTHPSIDHVQVIINPADEGLYTEATRHLKVLPWIAGGDTRQASVRNGLVAIESYDPDHVLIHDAARPFYSAALISRCLEALEHFDAVLPALPVTDTLKSTDGATVTGTVDRDRLVSAQTPQCFFYPAIRAAHDQWQGHMVTDDIALAEKGGIPVHWIDGDATNIKITSAEDVKKLRTGKRTDVRIGLGYDVHAFAEKRDMWLGGIQIPFAKGLSGHSDADVALHALTDAVLGAIGAGDIGTHFPPSDKQWKGVSSDRFLTHAARLVGDLGGEIANVDLTIICEAPKIGPYRAAMRARIAEILDLAEARVSIKGTTTEKLGFTGRAEGIAAQAIATVRLPE